MLSDYPNTIVHAAKGAELGPTNYKSYYLLGVGEIMVSQQRDEGWEEGLRRGIDELGTGWQEFDQSPQL